MLFAVKIWKVSCILKFLLPAISFELCFFHINNLLKGWILEEWKYLMLNLRIVLLVSMWPIQLQQWESNHDLFTKLEAWLNKILNHPKIFKTLPQIQKGEIIGSILQLFMHIVNDYVISAYNASKNGPHEN